MWTRILRLFRRVAGKADERGLQRRGVPRIEPSSSRGNGMRTEPKGEERERGCCRNECLHLGGKRESTRGAFC